EGPRHRAGAPAEESVHVGNVSQGPLAGSGRYRLHDGRGLDRQGTGDILLALRHGVGHAPGPWRQYHTESGRNLDEAGGSESDGGWGWLFGCEALYPSARRPTLWQANNGQAS